MLSPVVSRFSLFCSAGDDSIMGYTVRDIHLDIAFVNWTIQLKTEGLWTGPSSRRLTNTRYADDILVYAKSLEEFMTVTEILVKELNVIGLQFHFDKSKSLHNICQDEGVEQDYVDANR